MATKLPPDLQFTYINKQPWYFRRASIALATFTIFLLTLFIAIQDDSSSKPLASSEYNPPRPPSISPIESSVRPAQRPSDDLSSNVNQISKLEQNITIDSKQIRKLNDVDPNELIHFARSADINQIAKSDPTLLIKLAHEIKENPHSTNLLILKAETEIQSHRYRQAINTYTQLINKTPNLAELRYCRATAYSLNKDFNQALVDLRDAISKQPNLASIARKDPRFHSMAKNATFKSLTTPA
jgi:tetratricopeptide (TPR) repeat protein